MQHELYDSVDEMLAPETLSELAGQSISSVRCAPFEHNGLAGSELLAVETDEGQGPRYVLKRASLERDYLMRASGDRRCRSVTLWQHGLLDRLSPNIDHAIVACATDGPGWGILMRDVSKALFSRERSPDAAETERILDAMAAQHAAFWEAPELVDPALGLCSLQQLFRPYLPASVRKEPEPQSPPSWLIKAIKEGWELLPTLAEPDVSDILGRLAADPRPLCDALLRYPCTLVHGDPRSANLGVSDSVQRRVILLDWQGATYAPPGIDPAWYLCFGPLLPVEWEPAIVTYKRSLARRLGDRFDERWWQPQLELSLLGNALRTMCFACFFITHVEDEERCARWVAVLSWQTAQVRKGVRWL